MDVQEAFAETLEELRAKQAQAQAAMQAQTNALRAMIDYSGAILREAAQQYVPPPAEPEPEPEGGS